MDDTGQFYSGQAPLEKTQETSARLSALDAASERIEKKMRELLVHKLVGQLKEEETNEIIIQVIQNRLDRLFILVGLTLNSKGSVTIEFDGGELILDKGENYIAFDFQDPNSKLTTRRLLSIEDLLENEKILNYSFDNIQSFVRGDLRIALKDSSKWVYLTEIYFCTNSTGYEIANCDLEEEKRITKLSILTDIQKFIDEVEGVIRNNTGLIKK